QAQIDRMKVKVPLDVESAAAEKAELAAAIEALQVQASANPIEVKIKTDRSNMDRLEESLLRFRDRVGRMFGHGSRNDFFNLFGAGMRTLSLAITAPIQALGALGTATKIGIDTFNDMRNAGARLSTSLASGLAASLTNLPGLLITLAVAVTTAVVAFSSMAFIVPAVTMALGALFALLSTVAMAIVGSLAPIVPLLAALAAGAGVAAGA